MPCGLKSKMNAHAMTRRDFLRITSLSAAGLIAGCALDPVTGKRQFMLVSENTEIQIDKQNAPLQFSSDYGTLQDRALNNYIDQTGKRMAARTHRPHMPYSFQGVNATYVNAYAFPGGSIAATRGILLSLENEAELAALLGHELGHVNARHTAEQMSKGQLTQAIVGGVSAYAGAQSAALGKLASQLGMLGAGALLAAYSRDNEREADALGMGYMVGTGYGTEGFVGLMEMLNSMSKHQPSVTELLFATHPMSDERYRTTLDRARTEYQSARGRPLYRERYMDFTSRLRAMQGAIEEMQKGEKQMAMKNYAVAEAHFQTALNQAPRDYAGLVMMSKCQLVQKKYTPAQRYIEKAKQVFPTEAQAYHLAGYTNINQKNFDAALADFNQYEKLLPGNPNTVFFKGLALEGMEHFKNAANQYSQYLQVVNQGPRAEHAYQRLVEWGYIKP